MALNTKEKRIALRDAWIKHDIEKGYKREDFKGAIILTQKTPNEKGDVFLKTYTGTRSNHDLFYRYKTVQRLEECLVKYKETLTLREERTQARKSEPKRLTPAANAAKAIKAELKNIYPSLKLSVKSSNFSMGDSVSISWTNGPTPEQVKNVVDKYQYGHFDGMTDMYESSNSRDDIPQSKYVQVSREVTDDLKQLFIDAYNVPDFVENDYDRDAPRQVAYRFWHKTAIPEGATNLKVVKNEKTSGCGFETFYSLTCDVPQKKEAKKSAKKSPNLEKIEVVQGEINIIEYSAKSIAVIGDTKPIKDKLKALGGKFNFRLSCGAGWIFPAAKLAEIQTALTKKDEDPEPEETHEEEQKNDVIEHPATTQKNEVTEIPDILLNEEIKTFDSLTEITEAAQEGQQISLFNLSQLV